MAKWKCTCCAGQNTVGNLRIHITAYMPSRFGSLLWSQHLGGRGGSWGQAGQHTSQCSLTGFTPSRVSHRVWETSKKCSMPGVWVLAVMWVLCLLRAAMYHAARLPPKDHALVNKEKGRRDGTMVRSTHFSSRTKDLCLTLGTYARRHTTTYTSSSKESHASGLCRYWQTCV